MSKPIIHISFDAFRYIATVQQLVEQATGQQLTTEEAVTMIFAQHCSFIETGSFANSPTYEQSKNGHHRRPTDDPNQKRRWRVITAQPILN